MIKRSCTCDRCTIGGPKQPGDCPACWLWHNHPKYVRLRKLDAELEKRDAARKTKRPSVIRSVGNLVAAVAHHAVTGFHEVNDEEFTKRITICEACPFFTEKRTCLKCNCYMDTKARWREQRCPIAAW